MHFAYLIFGIFFYAILSNNTKDYLNPIGLGTLIWFSSAALSCYEPFFDLKLQTPWSLEMHLVVLLAGLAFMLPGIFIKKSSSTPKNRYVSITRQYLFLSNLLMALCLFAFLLRFGSMLLDPPLFRAGSVDAKSIVPAAIKGINYFDLMTPFIALVCIYEIRFTKNIRSLRATVLFGFIIFSIVSSLLFKVSRGDLLIIIAGGGYLVLRSGNYNFRKVVLSTAILMVFFLLYTFFRIPAGSLVNSHFGSGFMSIFSPIYTYIAMCFENLNKLVLNGPEQYTYLLGSGAFVLKFIFPEKYIEYGGDIEYYNTLFFNARTYLYLFYHDIGFLGVVFYPILISFSLAGFYITSTRFVQFELIMSFLQKAIMFMFFSNYYFGEMVILFPYIIGVLLSFSLFNKVRVSSVKG